MHDSDHYWIILARMLQSAVNQQRRVPKIIAVTERHFCKDFARNETINFVIKSKPSYAENITRIEQILKENINSEDFPVLIYMVNHTIVSREKINVDQKIIKTEGLNIVEQITQDLLSHLTKLENMINEMRGKLIVPLIVPSIRDQAPKNPISDNYLNHFFSTLFMKTNKIIIEFNKLHRHRNIFANNVLESPTQKYPYSSQHKIMLKSFEKHLTYPNKVARKAMVKIIVKNTERTIRNLCYNEN